MIRNLAARLHARGGAVNNPASRMAMYIDARSISSGMSKKPAIVRREVLRKMKRGVDRLPYQGPDPAISPSTPNGWRIAVAAVLERYPVVIPEVHPFEAKYLEGRFKWQQSVARPLPEELVSYVMKENRGPVDAEDALGDMYTPAPIVTEADKVNDMRSQDRALRERLYFVVKRSSSSAHYQFPQTLVTSPNTKMREYAELSLQSTFKPPCPLTFHFFSNSPALHLAHIYSVSMREKTGCYGVKVFFYRAALLSGAVTPAQENSPVLNSVADFLWARDSELPELLNSETYEAVKPLLFGLIPEVDFNEEYVPGEHEIEQTS